jgi:aryl carrier-like protein
LAHAALEAGDNQAQAGQDAVQMMTVHSSKGLEFDCVFISGLEEGLFPHENAMSDREGLEEERRLMYVAITRARKRLYLSCSQTRMLHGQTRYNLRSRFLEELPEGALKWITPRQGGFSSPGGRGDDTARSDWAARVVASLRSDLIDRGLDAQRMRLWVIDGGKALRKETDERRQRRHKAAALAPATGWTDANYIMRQPRVVQQWSTPDGTGGWQGSFYGTLDEQADLAALPTPAELIAQALAPPGRGRAPCPPLIALCRPWGTG